MPSQRSMTSSMHWISDEVCCRKPALSGWPDNRSRSAPADIAAGNCQKTQRVENRPCERRSKKRALPIPHHGYALGRHGAAVPETLVVHFADGTSETVEWNDAHRWQRYVWVKPSPAIYAELDPAQTHLLDANRINNSRIIDAEVGANSPEVPPTFLQRAMAKVFGGPASRSLQCRFPEAALQNVLTLLSTL